MRLSESWSHAGMPVPPASRADAHVEGRTTAIQGIESDSPPLILVIPREALDLGHLRQPGDPPPRPVLLHRFRHRLGVIEAAKEHRHVAAVVAIPEQRRAAVAAELTGGEIRGAIGRRLALEQLESIERIGEERADQAAGLALALGAVADVRVGGLTGHAVTDIPAETAPGERIAGCHAS